MLSTNLFRPPSRHRLRRHHRMEKTSSALRLMVLSKTTPRQWIFFHFRYLISSQAKDNIIFLLFIFPRTNSVCIRWESWDMRVRDKSKQQTIRMAGRLAAGLDENGDVKMEKKENNWHDYWFYPDSIFHFMYGITLFIPMFSICVQRASGVREQSVWRT